MDNYTLLSFLSLAEKLKCNLRHSWTSSGRQESVADHSWRLCLFSWFIRPDFPELDMDKVLLMCLFHDIGEAVTGDIPSFLKTAQHETKETEAIAGILKMLDTTQSDQLSCLFIEMQEQKTKEARLFKALDKLEVVLQHNEAPLETWLPLEYELNQTYGEENVREFPTLESFRKELKNMTIRLISGETSKMLEK